MLSFLVFLGVNVLAACSGAVFGPDGWYRALAKPSWQPPDWLFPIAWTALYLMIAVAGWLVWNASAPSSAINLAIGLYGVQLVFNALWSWLFFGLKRMDWALIDCIAMAVSIAATVIAFWPISTLAALLMLPYLAWVSFATFLNWTILRLNPNAIGTAGAA